jgi:hypothetical protein
MDPECALSKTGMESLANVFLETVVCNQCKSDLVKSRAVHSLTYNRNGHGPWDVYHCRPCAEMSCKTCVCSFENAVPAEEHVARANHPWIPLVPRLVEELPSCSRCGAWGKDLIRRSDGRCDHCARAQQPPARPSDIFAHAYPSIVEAVFKTLRPRATTPTFDLLRSLYASDPSRFRIISGIHQNTATDRLHVSLVVDCNPSSYTLHVYGYWKSYFRVTDVTIKGTHILTVAEF